MYSCHSRLFVAVYKMSFLYFAYGSNLLRERLLLQNPSAKFVAVGKLEVRKIFIIITRLLSFITWL